MPSYTWVCGACATSNPPGQDDCIACRCPAASSQQLRQQYRAAFEGVGPPVVNDVSTQPTDQGPRPPAFRPGTIWLGAASTLLGLAVIAFVLLWGGGPLLEMGGGPRAAPRHWYWSLPDGLMLASFAAILFAPPVALVCAVLGFRARGKLSLGPVGWIGLLLLVALVLSMCTS